MGGAQLGGNAVANGVYLYRLEGAGDVAARKMTLLSHLSLQILPHHARDLAFHRVPADVSSAATTPS